MHLPSQAAKAKPRMNRRDFLAASTGTGFSSAAFANQQLPAERQMSQGQSIVKVILQGGPSQIDLWDPKPKATADIRSAYKAISTKIAGIQVSECLPRIAATMDQFTIVRSITGSIGSHNLSQAETGSVPKTHQHLIQNQTQQSAATTTTFSTAQTFSHAQTLLQAGHQNIVLRFGNWDHHQQLSKAIKPIAQQLDQHLTHFIKSLARSGRLQQTTVLVWGEFGRSPRINAAGGRDHWPAINSALIAGGPAARGNVWGATSADGSHIVEAPICMSSLMQQCCHSPSACLA